ncbi:hypothetical protein ACFL6C_13090, partial [Myxococcota bacterium]
GTQISPAHVSYVFQDHPRDRVISSSGKATDLEERWQQYLDEANAELEFITKALTTQQGEDVVLEYPQVAGQRPISPRPQARHKVIERQAELNNEVAKFASLLDQLASGANYVQYPLDPIARDGSEGDFEGLRRSNVFTDSWLPPLARCHARKSTPNATSPNTTRAKFFKAPMSRSIAVPRPRFVVNQVGEISDREAAAIQDAVGAALEFFGRALDVPEFLVLHLQRVANSNGYVVEEHKLELGYGPTERHTDRLARAMIFHEAGHVLFKLNIRLADGRTLAEASGSAITRFAKSIELQDRVCEARLEATQPEREAKFQAVETGCFEEIERAQVELTRKLEKFARPVQAARQRREEAGVEREKYIAGPVRAFEELWADLAAVIMIGDPRAVSKGLQFLLAEVPGLEEQMTLRASQRDFSRPARNRFRFLAPFCDDDLYSILDISRHYMWTHYLCDPAIDRLDFSVAVMEVMEKEIRAYMAGDLEADHHDLNERFLTKLNAVMGRPDLPVDVGLDSDEEWFRASAHEYPELMRHAQGDREPEFVERTVPRNT